MEKISIFDIENYSNGKLIKKGAIDTIEEISIDSRTSSKNSLFVPIIGEVYDGHDFITDAYKNGCRNFLCDENHNIDIDDVNIVIVANTEIALGEISKKYKERFDIPFIGITGSVGKTSTKDIISSVLKEKYNVLRNEGNLNNNIGVPRTLLNLNEEIDIAVIEMGMDKKGELDYLSNIVNPDIAVISNIGKSHIMNFEDGQDGIFKAKMEIANHLKKDGLLIVNGDDKYLSTLKGNTEYNLITYGFNKDNDIYIEDFNISENKSNFTCVYKNEKYNFDIKSVAKHNIFNALVAIVIGFHFNLTKEEIDNGLDSVEFSKNRLDIFDTDNYKIINDTYNASYESIMSALEVLNSFKGRKVAILGDILELGSHSEGIHRDIGKNLKCDLLITIGNDSKYINQETEIENYHFDTKDEFYKEANNLLKEKDVILVKASHGIALDKVVEFLK